MDIWRSFAAKSHLKGAKKSFVHLLFFDGQESNFTCGRYTKSCKYKTYAPCPTKADSDLLFHVCYLQEPRAPDLTHVITTEESWVEKWLSPLARALLSPHRSTKTLLLWWELLLIKWTLFCLYDLW